MSDVPSSLRQRLAALRVDVTPLRRWRWWSWSIVQPLGMQIGTLLGPALGGVLVAGVGIPWAYAVDIAGLVVAMPIVLFPAFAETVLEEPRLLGLLYTAESVVVASMCWGGSMALVGLSPNI